jgi:hypothetical protein
VGNKLYILCGFLAVYPGGPQAVFLYEKKRVNRNIFLTVCPCGKPTVVLCDFCSSVSWKGTSCIFVLEKEGKWKSIF